MFTLADRVNGNPGVNSSCGLLAVDGMCWAPYNQRVIVNVTASIAGNAGITNGRRKTPMVLLEMSITPLGRGESVSAQVAECLELVERSGLEYELHSMGTIVEGELGEVLDLMRRCIEQVATHSDRVSCAAKIDFRRGRSGRLKSKVTSVEQKLGREVRKGTGS